jgi:transcriptional regulator with XRE-family HTH domain
MDFLELERRFVDHLRHRVRSGELAERRIASLTGISQPHIHNVLRGKRSLSPQTADVILHVLRIDLLDLLDPEDRLPPPA